MGEVKCYLQIGRESVCTDGLWALQAAPTSLQHPHRHKRHAAFSMHLLWPKPARELSPPQGKPNSATVFVSRSGFKDGLQTYAKPLLRKPLQLKPCRGGGRSFALQSRLGPSPGLLACSGSTKTRRALGNSSPAEHQAFLPAPSGCSCRQGSGTSLCISSTAERHTGKTQDKGSRFLLLRGP